MARSGCRRSPRSWSRTRTATATTQPSSWGSAWRAEAEEWIRARVDVTGSIEDERIKPWAAVLRVPTSEGLMFFKEPEPALAHEAKLVEILARRRSDLVTEVAFSGERGRMLMRDAGDQLSSLPTDPRHWEEALPLYAELQIAGMEDASELLAAGAFDRRSAVLPGLYEELVAEPAPGLTAAEYAQLRALIPEVRSAFEELGSSDVPETINNDDFTDGSVFVRDGVYRFLDWGDACVSHPFITLNVMLRVIELRHELPPGSSDIGRIVDSYLEPFTVFAPREELLQLVPLARRFGQILRMALYVEHPHWEEDPEELAWPFRLLLDPEAWRSWASDEAEQPPRQGPVS